MNSNISKNKRFLYIKENPKGPDEIYKLCLEFIQKGEQVLLMTCNHFNILPLMAGQQISKDMLQLLIIIYFPSIEDISMKLLELHAGTMTPCLIIVDLCDFVENHNQIQLQRHQSDEVAVHLSPDKAAHCAPLLPALCLCLASLLNLLNALSSAKQEVPTQLSSQCHAVVVLPSNSTTLTPNELKLIRNLYFYHKNEVLTNLNDFETQLTDLEQQHVY